MDRTIRYCQATDVLTIELVGTLASGPLARVIATYIDTQPMGQQTWAGLKAEISRNYLNEEEQYQMRKKVEQMYQMYHMRMSKLMVEMLNCNFLDLVPSHIQNVTLYITTNSQWGVVPINHNKLITRLG